MAMFTRVLCPVDFSDTSAHAVRYAHQVASLFGAALTVQHVYLPLAVEVPGMPEIVESIPDGEVERLTSRTLTFAARSGCGAAGPAVVIDAGLPADEIVARAARERTDLIVIGTHGASGFRHLVLGSVTEKVLRRAACPVLTVPPHVRDGAAVPFRHIVCAVDFSDCSLAALDMAATLAHTCQASLTAVHAIEWPWHEPPAPAFEELPQPQADALREYRRYVTSRATAQLTAALATIGAEKCDMKADIVHGKPHVQLLEIARTTNADLIALGVHGRSTLDVAVFGSTTNQVVRHATCPVLTVRR